VEVLADATRIVFFNPGESYRVSHPAPGGDDCTAFCFAPSEVRDAFLETRRYRLQDTGEFPARGTASGPRTVLLLEALRRLLDTGGADPLEVEELCMRLLRRVVAGLERSDVVRKRPRRVGTRTAHRQATDRARMFLASRSGESVHLKAVSRAAGCSPYHLARIFHREVGLTMHRYLNRLRLRTGLEPLADGSAGLTEIALSLGFSSHAHFTTAFQREFGLPPSAFRRELRTSSLREMSKKLEA
jgi:AraC-like DNA-binding protein